MDGGEWVGKKKKTPKEKAVKGFKPFFFLILLVPVVLAGDNSMNWVRPGDIGSGIVDTTCDNAECDINNTGRLDGYEAAELLGNWSWNQSLADTLYAAAGAGNASWNQTTASTLYYPLTINPFGYLNVSNSSLYLDDTNESTRMDIIYDEVDTNHSYWNWAYYWVNTNHTNWDDAYDWGDHSLVGYLTSYTETDPVYTDNSDALINTSNTYNCSGVHSCASVLYSGDVNDTNESTRMDVIYDWVNTNHTLWDKVNASFNQSLTDSLYAGISVTGDNASWNQSLADGLYSNDTDTNDTFTLNDLNDTVINLNAEFDSTNTSLNVLVSEVDGVNASLNTLTSEVDGVNTTATTAYNWGDHSLIGYITSLTGYFNSSDNETDPDYNAEKASINASIADVASEVDSLNTTLSGEIDGVNTTANAAYDWGDHSLVGYITSLSGYFNSSDNETDPVFTANRAAYFNVSSVTTVTANTTFNANISIIDYNRLCLNVNCSQWILGNTSGVYIQG